MSYAEELEKLRLEQIEAQAKLIKEIESIDEFNDFKRRAAEFLKEEGLPALKAILKTFLPIPG